MKVPEMEMISLAGERPLAQGRMRLVFRHPRDRSLLIKVIRPEVIAQRWGEERRWYKMRRRYGHYVSYVRECEEYIAGWAGHGDALPFAQKIVGLVMTDLGLGLVVEAVLGEDGELAPTLASLVKGREIDPQLRTAINSFLDDLISSNLIVADLNPTNIVRGESPGDGQRFVVIDGLGLSTVLPFKLIPAINRASKRRRAAALWKRLERFSRLHRNP